MGGLLALATRALCREFLIKVVVFFGKWKVLANLLCLSNICVKSNMLAQ